MIDNTAFRPIHVLPDDLRRKYGDFVYVTNSGRPIPSDQLEQLYEKIIVPFHREALALIEADIRNGRA